MWNALRISLKIVLLFIFVWWIVEIIKICVGYIKQDMQLKKIRRNKMFNEYYEVYKECETDLDFYNFLACTEGYGEEKVKEIMYNVCGGDDAYYHALEQAKEGE